MRVGIIGLGGIADKMADTIAMLPDGDDIRLFACASRTFAKAHEFAAKHGVPRAYGSYVELMADPLVDLVYIATPHSRHFEDIELALAHDKAFLCEKAFTVNKRQAAQVLKECAQKKIFGAEAIWTRYMPSYHFIGKAVAQRVIGKPLFVQANLGYPISHVARIQNPALAGGALLDVGVYPLNFAGMVFRDKPSRLVAACTYSQTGVDESDVISLLYGDGRMAALAATTLGLTDRRGLVVCEEGRIEVDNINNPAQVDIFNATGTKLVSRTFKTLTGYEFELRECRDGLLHGEIEPHSMPHAETLRIMGFMDEARKSFGLEYPFE